jgi:CBS domain-containing protein
MMNNDLYSEISRYRETHMKIVIHDHFKLNQLHDDILKQVLELSINQVFARFGPPPSPFSFFVMGSAGRSEQSVWSDQDHGIIYLDQSDEVKAYFLALGTEISNGLYQAGYPYCDGGVMASNPLWCKSLTEWQQQLQQWVLESSWESIRYLLIFLDGRSVYGEQVYVKHLKTYVYQTVHKDHLVTKFLNNTMYLKKGINVLGKLLVETHGQNSGSLNIKEIGNFPYVNAVRLLAIKENLFETSTLSRLERIPTAWIPPADKEGFKQHFLKLLTYRLKFGDHTDYDSGHYLPINRLTKEQTKEFKDIIKYGAAFFQTVRKLLEKDDSFGDE